MELEKLSFNQLKELLPKFDKNDMFSTLIRREMKNKYIQHKTQKKNQQNILSGNDMLENISHDNNSFSFYKNTSNMSKPPIYPAKKQNYTDSSDIESLNDPDHQNSFHSNYSHINNHGENISNINSYVPKESFVFGETIDRDKLNMELFSRFANEIEINNLKKTQKNTIRLE